MNYFLKFFNFGLSFLILIFGFSISSFAFDDKGWDEEKSTHFIVYYKNAEERFVRQTIDKAEEYYKSIAENLGFTRYDFWLWDKRAKIYIYDSAEDYQTATGKPAWSGGVAFSHQKVIETYPWAQGFMQSLLPHELGHIIFREFIGLESNCPSWLDEGVAMYQEKLKRKDIKLKLRQALEEKRLIPLPQLSQLNITFVNDKAMVELYYNEALSVMEFLMDKFGKDNFVKLCHALKERKPFDQAVSEAYRVYKDLEELNKAWFRYIKND